MGKVRGGNQAVRRLRELGKKIENAEKLRVGFLKNATYPDGTPVAKIAATHEFGGEVIVPEHQATVYFHHNERTGEIKNKFTKKGKSNFSQEITIPAHTITIPVRSYFRSMIAEKSPLWGDQVAAILKATGYDSQKTLELLGEKIKSDLQQSIINLKEPPNAKSTVRKKGFDNPLIETSHMLNSVDYEVKS